MEDENQQLLLWIIVIFCFKETWFDRNGRFVNGRVSCHGVSSNGEAGSAADFEPASYDKPYHAISYTAAYPGDLVVQIATHPLASHFCALLANKRIKCWGDGKYGQLGLTVGAGAAGAVRHDNPEWFKYDMSSLPYIFNTNSLLVAVGWRHSCSLFVGGRIRCWGNNDYGQLGQNNGASAGVAASTISTIPFISFGNADLSIDLTLGSDHCVHPSTINFIIEIASAICNLQFAISN